MGKETVSGKLDSFSTRLVGFMLREQVEVDPSSFLQAEIKIGGKAVGRVVRSYPSPAMDRIFGYASMDSDWGYAGIEHFCIESAGGQIPIRTVSSPILMTKSTKVAAG